MSQKSQAPHNVDYYNRNPFNDPKAEIPDSCIKCNSKVLKLVNKLPRTFKCSNGHKFTIREYRNHKPYSEL